MTVYLVYNNSESVDAIFDTERKALDFVIALLCSLLSEHEFNFAR